MFLRRFTHLSNVLESDVAHRRLQLVQPGGLKIRPGLTLALPVPGCVTLGRLVNLWASALTCRIRTEQ